MALLVALFATLVQPADARRRFFFGSFSGGSSYSERIEPVREMPDRPPFSYEGDFYELGYLYSGAKGNGYVLYRGDKYLRLDPGLLDAITEDLGFDPTAEHRAKLEADASAGRSTSANTLAPRPGESQDAFRERAREWARQQNGVPLPPAVAAPAPRSGMGGFLLALVGIGFIAALVFGAIRWCVRLALLPGAVRHASRAAAESDAGHDSFEQRVAARLQELQNSPPPVTEAPSAEAPPRPTVRTFGRRVA